MARAHERLPLREEPAQVRAEARTLLEESPEEGARLVGEASFVADLLWEDWRGHLEPAGMTHDRFIEISRGYADELRLWVVGERPWDHCAAGLAGRVQRRLPAEEKAVQPEVRA